MHTAICICDTESWHVLFGSSWQTGMRLQGVMAGLPSVGSCLHMPLDPSGPTDLPMPGSGTPSGMAFSPMQAGGSLSGSLTGSLASTLMQPRSLQPMGSLEALRGTWHPPHGAMTHRWSQGHLVPSEHQVGGGGDVT